ncbi:MAG: hypothetical protein U9O59_06345, partial [Actinomycetota bacterium]|nr:hypothetical protein [Actinomycetota bacterium]
FNEGLFNKKLYKKYQILTSNGIQKRYFHSIKTRKDIYVIKEYLVNGISNYLDNLVNVNINSIKDNINSIKDKHNPHSIVKESIVKKKKEVDFDFSKKEFINLTPEKLKGFDKKYSNTNVNTELEKMENWLMVEKEKKDEGKKNKIPKNYNLFIQNWLLRSNNDDK